MIDNNNTNINIISIIHIKLKPPNSAKYSLNTNSSVKKQSGIKGVGGVFKNHRENWILGFNKACYLVSIIQAEILAILEGLKLALERNLTLFRN